MRLKHLLFLTLSLVTMSLCACGSGGAGLNGGITVKAENPAGAEVSATATYTNPTHSNVIGVPITFTAWVGGVQLDLGTFNTNNSGVITLSFTPPPFNGKQAVTVAASSDNLSNFDSVEVTGRSIKVTPPPALTVTSTQAAGTVIPITIPPSSAFVALTDPFTGDVSSHLVTISASKVSTNPADTLVAPTETTTGSGGTALFPGATGTMVVPTSGGSEVMTITWTVTDTVTGLTDSAITTVTLTKSG